MGSGYEIARAVETLIASGHPSDIVWRMTPRKLDGWLNLLDRRKLSEAYDREVLRFQITNMRPKDAQRLLEKLRVEGR